MKSERGLIIGVGVVCRACILFQKISANFVSESDFRTFASDFENVRLIMLFAYSLHNTTL